MSRRVNPSQGVADPDIALDRAVAPALCTAWGVIAWTGPLLLALAALLKAWRPMPFAHFMTGTLGFPEAAAIGSLAAAVFVELVPFVLLLQLKAGMLSGAILLLFALMSAALNIFVFSSACGCFGGVGVFETSSMRWALVVLLAGSGAVHLRLPGARRLALSIVLAVAAIAPNPAPAIADEGDEPARGPAMVDELKRAAGALDQYFVSWIEIAFDHETDANMYVRRHRLWRNGRVAKHVEWVQRSAAIAAPSEEDLLDGEWWAHSTRGVAREPSVIEVFDGVRHTAYRKGPAGWEGIVQADAWPERFLPSPWRGVYLFGEWPLHEYAGRFKLAQRTLASGREALILSWPDTAWSVVAVGGQAGDLRIHDFWQSNLTGDSVAKLLGEDKLDRIDKEATLHAHVCEYAQLDPALPDMPRVYRSRIRYTSQPRDIYSRFEEASAEVPPFDPSAVPEELAGLPLQRLDVITGEYEKIDAQGTRTAEPLPLPDPPGRDELPPVDPPVSRGAQDSEWLAPTTGGFGWIEIGLALLVLGALVIAWKARQGSL